LQAVEESGTRADPHHRDEDREPHVVEGPQGGLGDSAEGAIDGSEIAAQQPGDEGPGAGREAEGYAADENAERPDHDACQDAQPHEYRAGPPPEPIGIAQHLDRPRDVTRGADDLQHVAAVHRRPEREGHLMPLTYQLAENHAGTLMVMRRINLLKSLQQI